MQHRTASNILKGIIFGLLLLIAIPSHAQDVYAAYRQNWLKKAEDNKPVLQARILHPVKVVKLEKDTGAYQGWKAVDAGDTALVYNRPFKPQSGIVLDFGEHLTGYFAFSVRSVRGAMDAPTRLKFTFGEVPSEMATPFDPYPGQLSRAWMQDEIVTVTESPATITIPRRLACRFVKIELLGTSGYSDFAITGMQFKATTSVTVTPPPLAAGVSPIIKDIDRVGLNTLKECMQTVYEDGPKRDARLWIGDMYLESLANRYSFHNDGLTRRSLYLLAGLSGNDGILFANVFERPQPHAQVGSVILDYCYLYNVAVKEYLLATGDKQTALNLWPVVKKQLDLARKYTCADGMIDYKKAASDYWIFFDWKDDLDKQAALQAITVYALDQTYELAKLLGKENEIADVPALSAKIKHATRANLFDKNSGFFVSGEKKQVSYATHAWMALSGIATKAESQKALKKLPLTPDAVKPGAPCMYHYYIEALVKSGLKTEAKQALINYWGGMVNKGADTFWEVYDPKDQYKSPYNFFPVNSYCHAWSCTPVYFIRKYPEVFQE